MTNFTLMHDNRLLYYQHMFYQSSPVPAISYAEVASLQTQREVLAQAFFMACTVNKVQMEFPSRALHKGCLQCTVVDEIRYISGPNPRLCFFSNPNSKTISFVGINN